MKGDTYKNELDNTRSKKKYWRLLAAASIATNLILSLAVMGNMNNVRTHIMPPTVTASFWLEDNKVSPEYIRQMAHWFSGLVLNVHPDIVDSQHKMFLSYVSPRIYPTLKSELAAEAERVKRNAITQIFFQRQIQVGPKKNVAAVVGRKITYVGKTETSNDVFAYKLRFAFEDGRIYVTEYEKANVHDPLQLSYKDPQAATNSRAH